MSARAANEYTDHFIQVLGHCLPCGGRIVLLERQQDTAVLIFRAMGHILWGVVVLQALEHAAVTMAQ